MKTISLFYYLLAILLSFSLSISAAVVDLTGNGDVLKSTLGSISDGDTILLERGMTYDLSGTQLDKSVVVKSAAGDGAMASLTMGSSSLDVASGSTIAKIVFADVEISGDYAGGYLMNFSTAGTIGEFILDNVNIHHLRGVFRAKNADAKTINTFSITNSLVDSIGGYGVMIMDNAAAVCTNVTLSNSTFSNVDQILRWRSPAEASVIAISNCTVYNTPVGGYIMRLDGAGPTAAVEISNTIFGISNNKLISGTATINATNCYATSQCLLPAGSFAVAPTTYANNDTMLWVDVATGDFNYADGAFAGIGNAGDPRWVYKPVLKHSYTFEGTTAEDVVGSVDGVISGTGTVVDGAYTSATDGDFITFPAADLALNTYSSITTEAFIRAGNATNSGWSMFAYFGGATGSGAYFVSVARGDNVSRTEIVGGGFVNSPELEDGKLHHLVSVLTNDTLFWYVDGDLKGKVANTKTIADISTANAWLCKGGWPDPTWLGSIYEFNIYEGSLDPAVIQDRSMAFLGASDSRLSSLMLSTGDLFPAFSPDVTEYAVAIPDGASTIVATSTGVINGVEILGGSVDVSNGPVNDTIKVTSLDKMTETRYIIRYVTVSADCYVPTYNASIRPNIVSDAEVSDLANFGGWGNKSINLDPEYVYCGLTSGKVVGNNGGSIDVALTGKLKPNTEYMVKAMVYVAGTGQYQIGLWGAQSAAIDHATTLNDQWEEVTFTFTTQATLPGDEGMYFNNYGKGGTLGFIDNWELIDITPLKIGYVNFAKDMAVTASQLDNDPIIQMLKLDPNFDVDVQLVAADSAVDFSAYSAVVIQEVFGSGSQIYTPAGALALEKLDIPFVYNKIYALRDGKAITDTTDPKAAAVGPDDENAENQLHYYLEVAAENQSNPLFSGINFDDDSVRMFDRGAYDDGAALRAEGREYFKALQYGTNIDIIGEGNVPLTNTLLAVMKGEDNSATSVCVNDIPAGTRIGEQDTLKARMIAICQNSGAINYDMGSNMTIANLTLWRNAVYVASGLNVPATAVENSSDLSALTASVGVMGPTFDPAVLTYQLNVPMGTSSVILTGVSVDPNGKSAPLTVMLSGADTTVTYAAYAPIGMDSTVYSVAIHVASDNEILYLGNGKTAATAHGSDVASMGAIVNDGYSVTYMDRQSINVVGFDYSGYKAVIFGSACGSSDLKPFAAAGYPIPCITLKGDGPRGDKWGWVDNKNAEQWKDVKLSSVASDSAALIAGLKMVVADKLHYITQDYSKGEAIMWSDATLTSPDFAKITLPGLNLLDSVTTAIPLTTYAGLQADYSGLSNAWAIPTGASVRSLQADNSTYARVTTTNRMVVLGVNSDATILANSEAAKLLVRSLEWVLGAEDLSEPKKVAYLTFAKAMDAGAAPTTYDPIIRLLQADANLEVTVLPLAETDTVNLSGYDVAVVQEAFGSKAAIFMPTGALGMANIPVPFVYNKSYAMKDTRGFSGGATGSGTDIQNVFTIDVDAAKQANPLFNGITFENNQVQLFVGGADDSGAAGGKALNFAKDVVLSDTTTLLAMETGGVGTVCINDIPAGTTIGSETTKARMITLGMNYGAITKDNGDNINAAGLTIWRNAVYVAAGLTVPTEPAVAPMAKALVATLSDIGLNVGTITFDPAVKTYNVDVPTGTKVVNVTATTTDVNATVEGAGTVLTLTGSGTATLVVTAENGISTATYTVNITVLPDGLNDQKAEEITVYPTVSSSDFNVVASVGSVVTIYDVTGTVVASEVTTASKTTMSVSKAGMYFVKVEAAGVTKTTKVVKVN